MKVLVTGSGGHLARVVLARLLAAPEITRLVGVDRRPGGLRHPKLREHALDVRAPELARLMAGVDAVVHMAFVLLPARGRREEARAINVGGTQNVAALARAHGVGTLVHLSSAAVYGAWADQPPRLAEDAPLRPLPGFAYAEDKAAVEQWLDTYEQRRDSPRLVRLRPHVILGPNALALLRLLLRQPCYPILADPQPLTQCVWEDDVAEAVHLALTRPVCGAYNLAAGPELSFRDMQRLLHRLPIPVPLGLMRAAHQLAWRFTPACGEPAWSAGLRHSLVLDTRRAERELGWTGRVTTYECLQRLFDRPRA
ncbi:NAD-dependent epimerase/dehydratase family protein [Ectothiorhodospiraceae bacterium 2226]|nr:NAD-dependent epimerase/dehydratase family protein [Ectothiorhodospiraceae bacterium 2226]